MRQHDLAIPGLEADKVLCGSMRNTLQDTCSLLALQGFACTRLFSPNDGGMVEESMAAELRSKNILLRTTGHSRRMIVAKLLC